MKSKKGDFNFVLLFSLIAGTAILILAIYGAVNSGETLRFASEAEVAKSLDVIIDPLQSGFFAGATNKITFNTNTKIYNECDDYDGFGKNTIVATSESSIGEKWPENLIGVAVYGKYLFTEPEEGKTFYIFSKPLELPYRVADLIFLTSKNYCFVYPPEEISEEILGMKIPNIGIETFENNTCKEDSTRVCFGAGDCEIIIEGKCNNCNSEYEYGNVIKDDGILKYSRGLMMGAIISDKELYECNVNRLLFRTASLASIYSQKADLMNMRDCNTLIKADMETLKENTINANAKDLHMITELAILIEKRIAERREACRIW